MSRFYLYFPPDFSNDFHVWTLIWTPNEIAVLVDYSIVRKCAKSGNLLDNCNPISGGPGTLFPDNPMRVLVNIAAHTSACTPVGTNATMEVDYVRIWDETNPPDCDEESLFISVLAGNDPANTYHVSNSITTLGYAKVDNGMSGNWTAGNFIEINEDFEVEGEFTAEIIPCMPSCLFCREIDSVNANNTPYELNQLSLSSNGANHNINNSLDKEEMPENLKSNILLTPNPSTGLFTIHNPFKMICYVTITDVMGRVVTQSTIYNQHSEIDISAYSKGIYFLKVQSTDPNKNGTNKIYTEKVVIQ